MATVERILCRECGKADGTRRVRRRNGRRDGPYCPKCAGEVSERITRVEEEREEVWVHRGPYPDVHFAGGAESTPDSEWWS